MIECEATGKNIEQAITNALFELKAMREDVDIKILDQGGFFKKARVYVKISDDAIEKYQKVRKLKEEDKKEKLAREEKEEQAVEEPKKVEEKREIKEKREEKIEENKGNELNIEKLNEAERGKQFLQGLLNVLNIDGKVLVEENESEIFYEIQGEKVSSLIGFRGDCLNSIQYLISLINSKNNRHSKKVRLDIDGFKDKRKASLEALAERIAKKVLKTRHSSKLEPMTAYERRIIHTVIQNYEELTSYSTGEEPNRYLTIAIKEKTDN